MKKITVWILFIVSIAVNAQKVTELNNDLYKIDLGKSPIQEMKILKRESLNDNYKPIVLKKGDYVLKTKKGVVFTFFINDKEAIQKGQLQRISGGKEMTGYIENGKLQFAKAYKDKSLILSIVIKHNDSLAHVTSFDKNGKTRKEEIDFFTAKNFEKKITTTYNEDGSYSIENQINKTLKKFNAKGELITTKKNDTTAKEVIEDKKEKE